MSDTTRDLTCFSSYDKYTSSAQVRDQFFKALWENQNIYITLFQNKLEQALKKLRKMSFLCGVPYQIYIQSRRDNVCLENYLHIPLFTEYFQ